MPPKAGRKTLLTSMTTVARNPTVKSSKRSPAKEAEDSFDRIRGMLLIPQSHDPQETLTHVKALMAEPRRAHSTR